MKTLRLVRQDPSFAVDRLEPRLQLAVSLTLGGSPTIVPGSPVNASNEATAWQSEMSIAVNPTDPLNLAGLSMRHSNANGTGTDTMTFMYSLDGGATWTSRALGNADDGLGGGRFDPTLVFDETGRLFVGYGYNSNSLAVIRSQDKGESFDDFDVVEAGSVDKFWMTSGRDHQGNPTVYIAYSRAVTGGNEVVVAGCNSLAGSTFDFGTPVTIADGPSGFACPAVGPNGELYVSWVKNVSGINNDAIMLTTDSNGIFASPGFGDPVPIRPLSHGAFEGLFDLRPAAQFDRGIFTCPVLASDRRPGAGGNLYVSFAERDSQGSVNTNIKLGYSTDGGETWQFSGDEDGPPAVDTNVGTDFHAWVDVDQATGSVNLLYYTTDGVADGSLVKMRMATKQDVTNWQVPWTVSNVTSITSYEGPNGPMNDPPSFGADYREYIGMDVEQGTAHGLFAFEPFAQGSNPLDLEAVYLNAAFVNANNKLTINGTSGADTIEVNLHPTNNSYLQVKVNNVDEFVGRSATVGKIEINGGDGGDTIIVDSAITLTTTIYGEGGNDSIVGGYGRDVIYGGTGNDIAYGRNGNDWFDGGAGTDLLDGGAGDDQFMALDEEVDTLYGGSGWDSATCDLGVIVEDANTFIEEFLA